jgi:hypothetical protein
MIPRLNSEKVSALSLVSPNDQHKEISLDASSVPNNALNAQETRLRISFTQNLVIITDDSLSKIPVAIHSHGDVGVISIPWRDNVAQSSNGDQEIQPRSPRTT